MKGESLMRRASCGGDAAVLMAGILLLSPALLRCLSSEAGSGCCEFAGGAALIRSCSSSLWLWLRRLARASSSEGTCMTVLSTLKFAVKGPSQRRISTIVQLLLSLDRGEVSCLHLAPDFAAVERSGQVNPTSVVTNRPSLACYIRFFCKYLYDLVCALV